MDKIVLNKETRFIREPEADAGAVIAARNVMHDMELIFGEAVGEYGDGEKVTSAVIYGTVGQSPLLDRLIASGRIDIEAVRGKWEVYSLAVVSDPVEGICSAVIIAGSDKRGTIYGLYHLSELMGVSPLVNWNHVYPRRRSEIVLDESANCVSKPPSVKYRGFFINDEWPAFGNWANTHFGGVNAACYERIFELLLRLKGNYLWPAMWGSDFSLEGPGLKSAELADEMGVVMGTSHHEPCCRSGNEYGRVRGEDSEYGDAWSFLANEEGIKKFWRDGLIRNRPFENVITMGMRGENDTAILGKDATLEDNIELLRKVLRTQNRLLRETVNPDLSAIPRQLVLFTEVEEFFYGNKDIKGLMGDPELEGVTLMLSDNNHGATRTLPSAAMREHNGGYGMYYHMDMHGGPHSYQWIGSTYLPKIWEQMTMAYAFGVREIWVTNVGDIGTQEFGLSYFLDLAYDIEKWGGEDAAVTDSYTKDWISHTFGHAFEREDLDKLYEAVIGYTFLLARRKHEKINEWTYHPVHFGEADAVLETSERLLAICGELKNKCPKDILGAFIALIFYPVCGTANLMEMWVYAAKNRLYARQNRLTANLMADKIRETIEADYALTDEYHQTDNGYYYGFGLSEHIGFVTWDDANNQYPIMRYVHPANGRRMIIAKTDDERYVTGLPTFDRRMVWTDALRQDVCGIEFTITCAGVSPMAFKIETDCDWMTFSETEGEVELERRVTLRIHKDRFTGVRTGSFRICGVGFQASAEISVEAANRTDLPENVFVENDGYICMKAVNYQEKRDTESGGFRRLVPCTREGSAIKAYPVTTDFMTVPEKPYVLYRFLANRDGEYNIRFWLEASTPVVYEREQYICFSISGGEMQVVNTVEEVEKQFFLSAQWSREATDHIKIVDSHITCKKGVNELRFYAASPAIVLEKIAVYHKDTDLKDSYMGPGESYILKA
ncbi:MAG: glycosyl hydrolase 115 family protein [Muribaculum sp.]|nr:glycosyl hydrolase 115 family protein [Muribaculum sp.]